MKRIVKSLVLGSFFRISLSSKEEAMAYTSINDKYAPSILKAMIYSVLMMPATFLLDTGVIINVLIPITMVAGTAWFSVSLASMKEKFEIFGLELTKDLFTAFVLSLMMLFLLSAASMTDYLWMSVVAPYRENGLLLILSSFTGVLVVGKLMWSVFSGSLKYDMNDSMLAGQNEAAELYFKRSLSVLHKTSDLLREDIRDESIANYSLGVAFFEVYSALIKVGIAEEEVQDSIEMSNALIKNPSMLVEDANRRSIRLLEELMTVHIKNGSEKLLGDKSYNAVLDELECLKNNSEEEARAMIDVRFSVALVEFATLVDTFGETLFFEQMET